MGNQTATGNVQAPRRAGAAPATRYAYDAFLSYAHLDQGVATQIQKDLHHIARHPGKLRALRVFRDITDLTASPDLWGRVTDAMDRSHYLIVVLSPHAAASPWVDREVRYWLEHRDPDRLMFVMAAGRLKWGARTQRFDPGLSDAAVDVLTQPGVLVTEPLYVDVSTKEPDPDLKLFRSKMVQLAGPLHGKSPEELASDDRREQRRFRRLRRAAIIALAVLTVAAVTLAGVAIKQRSNAITQRNHAIALNLTSRGQSMLGGFLGGGDISALQQILAAPHISPTADVGALYTGVVARRDTLKIIETANNNVNAMALSPDGYRIVAGGDQTLQIWDADAGTPIGEPLPGHTDSVFSVAFSPDGQRIVAGSADGTLRLWDAAGRLLQNLAGHHEAVTGVAFSPDSRRIVSVGWGGVRLSNGPRRPTQGCWSS